MRTFDCAIATLAISGMIACGGIRLPSAAASGATSLIDSLSTAQSRNPLFAHAPSSPFAVEGGPQNIKSGDVNNDGKLDLITANEKGRSATLLVGDGKGGFRTASGSPIGLPYSPGEMALEDINSDGKLDLAVTNHDSYGVVVLFGNGNGGFTAAPGSPFVTKDGNHPHTHGLAVRDVNGDGKLDLITVNNADNDVSIMLGDGKGHFTRAPDSPFAVGAGPYPLAVGDVNGDDLLDIVTPDVEGNTVTILAGNGKGGFTAATGSPITLEKSRPFQVALGNINGDKMQDLIITHDDTNLITILLNNGKGKFTPAPGSPFDLGHGAWRIEVAEVSNDGKMDLIAAAGDSVRVLLGNGNGSFQAAPGSPFAVGKGAWRFATGDLNSDGKLDIAASSLESNSVSILLAK